jgi:hypothetical protein
MRRRKLAALAITSVVALVACGSGGESSESEASSAALDTSVTATIPPLTPSAGVLAAVAAAPQIEKLPDDVTPALTDVAGDAGFNMLKDRNCLPNFDSTSMSLDSCIFGDPTADTTVVVLGDSHASMWLPALDLLGRKNHWKVYDMSKVSCGAADLPDPYLTQESRQYTECVEWHQWAHAKIRELAPDLVLLTSLVNDHRTGGDSMDPDHWREALEKTMTEVAGPTTKIAVIGDIPEMPRKPPDCLAAHMNDVQECSGAANEVVGSKFDEAEATAAQNRQATYISAIPWFCSATCTAVVGNMIVYNDTQHSTATYIRYLAGALDEALQPVIAAA